jgi:hypothetical protein
LKFFKIGDVKKQGGEIVYFSYDCLFL